MTLNIALIGYGGIVVDSVITDIRTIAGASGVSV